MDCVRRLGIIVRPTRQYVDWANALPQPSPRISLAAARANPSIYLVSTTPDRAFGERYLLEIFENELEARTSDESLWPCERTPHVFQEWFEVALADQVWDVDDGEAMFGDEVPGACGWCGRALEDGASVVTITLVRAPGAPLLEPGALTVSVGARSIPATVPLSEPEAVVGGAGAIILLCSEECAAALRSAMSGDRPFH
jgi:hypothetical protein